MSENQTTLCREAKAAYIAPCLDIIQLCKVDIITTSNLGDENQGEWDPQ